ncbi:SDR family oxidoreductase [uncultured Sunxiuqinia sp.]|uniref:SDR family oxidoreductase n=1 Tax=uncultured Sunxiuqinia sp. TaxID=1573825 RepID=UPI002AA73C22|nr:SDR family oxidoreductase [uncultured Sunxiuqinia sp.]
MNTAKIAIITGASRGIGKACAIGLAGMGYHCLLISRTQQQLEELAEEIQENGGRSSLFAVDLTKQNELEECIQKIKKHYGRIDVLVNNAGMFIGGNLQVDVSEFRQQLELNITANFKLLQAFVPVMKEQQSGAIFNIASRAGKIGFANSGAYSASKFGLVGLNESLYRELAEYGISVTAICPGYVATEMAKLAGTPLPEEEMIQPSDIFLTIEYLLKLAPNTRVKEIIIEAKGGIQ